MFKKIPALIINSLFGALFCYSALIVYVLLKNELPNDTDFNVKFIIFVVIWLSCCIAYNVKRFREAGNSRFFWLSTFLPAAVLMVALIIVIMLFF